MLMHGVYFYSLLLSGCLFNAGLMLQLRAITEYPDSISVCLGFAAHFPHVLMLFTLSLTRSRFPCRLVLFFFFCDRRLIGKPLSHSQIGISDVFISQCQDLHALHPLTPANASPETALEGNAEASIFARPNETGSKLLIQTMAWQIKARYTLSLESLAQIAFIFIRSWSV